MSEHAKRAYIAFWHHLDGEVPGDWESLTETERESWRAAVVAAVDAPAPKAIVANAQEWVDQVIADSKLPPCR